MPRQSAAGASDFAASALAGAAPGLASSTSAFTIRPFGPEPLIWARSSPLSAAIRRARGEAKIRPPSPDFGAGGALPVSALGASAFSGLASSLPEPSSAFLSVSFGASALASPPPEETSPISSALSPSSRRTAMGVLTFTPSLPSSIRILPILPSSTASNSIVALSVSISAMMSPELTSSPSLTSHLASVPSSMVGDRAGIRISVGMVVPPYL